MALRAEPLVERAAGREVVAAEGHRREVDRVDVAGRSLLPVAEVVGHGSPRTGDCDARIVERSHERRDDVAAHLEARVEQDRHRADRPA